MKDKKHAEMLESFVTYLENEGWKIVGIEEPFNYYGERGCVDVIFANPKISRRIILGELKTKIEDLGETIRQVRKSIEFFPKYASLSKREFDLPPKCFGYNPIGELVLLPTEENLKTIVRYDSILKRTPVYISFYDPEKRLHLFYNYSADYEQTPPIFDGIYLIKLFMKKDLQLTVDGLKFLRARLLGRLFRDEITQVTDICKKIAIQKDHPFLITKDYLERFFKVHTKGVIQ